MFIHLCIIYGCFCATTAELNSYNKDQIALSRSQRYLALYRKMKHGGVIGILHVPVIGNSAIDSLNPLENRILQPTPGC